MTANDRPLRVAVIGAADAGATECALARDVGRHLAKAGVVVVCGGRSGVMEAVSRGAAEAGGVVLGILPGGDPAEANPWVSIPLASGLGEARNALVVGTAEAVIAIGGGWGTLSEIAFARKMGRPTTTLGRPPAEGLELTPSADAAAATRWAIREARVYRESGVGRLRTRR